MTPSLKSKGTIEQATGGNDQELVFSFDAGATDIVVEINVGRIFVAGFFVRTVAKRFGFREPARADVEWQFGALWDFVG
jgi:hypothetical protein